MKLFSLPLLLSIFATSCNGQATINQKQSGAEIPRITNAGQPKILKTLGSGIYDNVHCGIQDKAGNLWFGTTNEGVYRYDGHSFINFTEKDGLCSNTVCSIVEDKAGNILFGSEAGLCKYDGKTFTFIPIPTPFGSFMASDNSQNAKNTPSSMIKDKNGIIWLGTSKGVYCYDGSNFTHFLENDGVINPNGLHLKFVQSMMEDRNGSIWFTTWFDGLCRYDGKTITNFKPNGEIWFAGLAEDKRGNIWVGRRDKGVCRYDGKGFTNVLQYGLFDSCGVNTIVEDKEGNMWFGTEAGDMTKRETTGGVWRYDGKTFKNYTTEYGLCNDAVFFALKDRTGNVWFGTRNTGLCRYDGKIFTDFSDKGAKE